MIRSVLWTPKAEETFDLVINIIQNSWGDIAAGKFIKITYNKINLIKHQPYLYKASISKNIRQVIVTKQTSMFYEVTGDYIVILFFMDNRQEPLI